MDFLKFFEIFGFSLDFSGFFVIPFKVTKVTTKVTKVTTGHQKLPKMGQNSNIIPFLPEGQKNLGRSRPQDLEVGPSSGPYFLVRGKG